MRRRQEGVCRILRVTFISSQVDHSSHKRDETESVWAQRKKSLTSKSKGLKKTFLFPLDSFFCCLGRSIDPGSINHTQYVQVHICVHAHTGTNPDSTCELQISHHLFAAGISCR